MIKLQQALDFQLRAVRNHQEALATLDDRMHRLDASCCRYNKALGGIDMEPLRQNSLKLARIMGDFLDRPDIADKDSKSPHAA